MAEEVQKQFRVSEPYDFTVTPNRGVAPVVCKFTVQNSENAVQMVFFDDGVEEWEKVFN